MIAVFVLLLIGLCGDNEGNERWWQCHNEMRFEENVQQRREQIKGDRSSRARMIEIEMKNNEMPSRHDQSISSSWKLWTASRNAAIGFIRLIVWLLSYFFLWCFVLLTSSFKSCNDFIQILLSVYSRTDKVSNKRFFPLFIPIRVVLKTEEYLRIEKWYLFEFQETIKASSFVQHYSTQCISWRSENNPVIKSKSCCQVSNYT